MKIYLKGVITYETNDYGFGKVRYFITLIQNIIILTIRYNLLLHQLIKILRLEQSITIVILFWNFIRGEFSIYESHEAALFLYFIIDFTEHLLYNSIISKKRIIFQYSVVLFIVIFLLII